MAKRTVLANDIIMLDPADCGSTVAYTIVRDRLGVSSTVELADCNRKIEWYFSHRNADAVIKIDRAIKLLTDFRAALVKARPRARKYR